VEGTYTILLAVTRATNVRFGRLGNAKVGKGYYLYTGSALGRASVSLEGRLKRHSQISKKSRWHVDYLTSSPFCRVKGAVCLRSGRRLECSINRAVGESLLGKPILPRIGASDCNCSGHLMRVGTSTGAKRILCCVNAIYSRYGVPIIISNDFQARWVDLHPISSEKHLGKS
jgi:Uri superfamily endonuclease